MIIKPHRVNSSKRSRMTRFQCRWKRSQMQFRRRIALTYSNWRWSNAHIDSRSFRWRFLHYILTEDYLGI